MPTTAGQDPSRTRAMKRTATCKVRLRYVDKMGQAKQSLPSWICSVATLVTSLHLLLAEQIRGSNQCGKRYINSFKPTAAFPKFWRCH